MIVEPRAGEIQAYYRRILAEHGACGQGVGYGSDEKQQLRFEQLYKLVADTVEPFSVCDWGCGYGALLDYLLERHAPVTEYRGYDISPEMLAAARDRFDNPCASFVEASEPDAVSDYGFISGTFNARFGVSEREWQAHVEDVLTVMASRTRKGFAFNLITSYVQFRNADAFYADPCHFFDFCKRHLSPLVTLIHDYMPWDFTIIVRTDNYRMA